MRQVKPPAARKATAFDRHIGVRIRGCRSAQGISQEKLAEALGISFQQVQKYESGANRVSAATLFRIAKELRLPLNDLLPEEESKDQSPEDQRTLRDLAQITPLLNADGKLLVINLARTLARCRPLRTGRP